MHPATSLTACDNLIKGTAASLATVPLHLHYIILLNQQERNQETEDKQRNIRTFRSDNGADAFFAIHSIADTVRKNNHSQLEAINAILSL